MKHLLAAAVALMTFSASRAAAQETCPPAGWDRARLEALKQADFEIAARRARERFARGLTACLASPDPFLRDGVAFEALSRMLRDRRLGVSTQTALVNDLLPRLESADPSGFEQPFAALVLSEVVRAERLDPHFTDAMRADVLDRSIAYFAGVRDYRGFDETEGWRHGVAHGADLLLQLAANQSYGREELVRIRDVVATQIAPPGQFYIYGEPARLARPILVIASRGIFTADEWSAWLAGVASPSPLPTWSDAFTSQAGLAKRHNTTAFLQTIFVNAQLSENDGVRALRPGAEAALRALP